MPFTNLALVFITLSSVCFPASSRYFQSPNNQLEDYDQIKPLIDGNNGVPSPHGYYSHFVVFVKKPNKHFDEPFKEELKDFSLKDPFLCSGTILTRRWILTTAKPIAYYPIGSYWMVSQWSIDLPADTEVMNTHEIDHVMIHPDHQPGDVNTDLALARTAEELKFTFETRNVNLGFNNLETAIDNCKMVVWSWLVFTDTDRRTRIGKGEIAIEIKFENCSADTQFFYCFAPVDPEHQPCGINLGAPIICNTVLVGVYTGDGNSTICDGRNETKKYRAVRMDKTPQGWIDETISSQIMQLQGKDSLSDEGQQEMVLKMCGSGSTTNNPAYALFVVVTLLLKLIE